MSKIKLGIVAIAAVLVFSAVASSVASAAPEGWMINGVTLPTGSKANLMTTGKVTSPAKLAASGVKISCNSETIEGIGPEIVAPNKGGATSVIFKECTIIEGAGCSLASETISTVPVLITELTLDGILAVKGAFVPETGKTFTTIKYNGETCALLGVQPVKGKARFLAPLGQHEMTWQPVLLFNEGTELQEGSSTATLHGAGLLATEKLEPWSFL